MWSALSAASGAQAAPGLLARDRIEALYSDQIPFNRDGEPLLTLHVASGQRRVELRTRGTLRWRLRPEDEGAWVETPTRGPWEVRVEDVRAGERREWAVVARFSALDPSRTASSLAQWRSRGHEARVFEEGVLVGLGRHRLDTRTATVGVDPRAPGAGRRAAVAGGMGRTLTEWVSRPTGWIVARHVASGVELRARELLTLEPAVGETISLSAGHFGRRHARATGGTRRYGGRLSFLVGEDGRLLVVNTAPAEEVLAGTVPAELFPNAPIEALKAQAVAARGQLLARVGTRHRGEPFSLCDSTHCQVYHGRPAQVGRAVEAVRATRGEVLVDSGGLTDSVYGSACGGHTESLTAMWGGRAAEPVRGVPDGPGAVALEGESAVRRFIEQPPASWCSGSGERSGVFRWTVELTGAELSRRLSAVASIGAVHTVEPLARGRSGRVLRVRFVGATGSHTVEGEHAHRRVLGGLKSGLWVVERQGGEPGGEPSRWRFMGGGFGHGVGLCQHGAIGQAHAGRDYRAILGHYFPGARLERLW